MSSIDDMIVRFDVRDGYDLVDYEIVGLPVWRLGLIVQSIDESPISTTEEFFLKFVNEGMKNIEQISSLLGLSEKIVISTAGDLVRMDAIANIGGNLSLTKKGHEIFKTASLAKPAEHPVSITYDALIKQPKLFEYYQLFQPKDLKNEGIRAISASPNRKPDVSELNIDEVESLIKKGLKRSVSTRLMRIKGVTSRKILYQKSVMLIFKAKNGADIQVGFTIDKRLSDDHEISFAKNNGIKRYDIQEFLNRKEELSENILLGPVQGKKIRRDAVENFTETKVLARDLSEINGKIKEVVDDHAGNSEFNNNDIASKIIRELSSERDKLEKKLNNYPVRMVSVYEHPDYLWDAISSAKSRILIISPWITRAVVDNKFLRALRKKLSTGVEVFIGYGLDERNYEAPEITSAERELISDSKKFENLYICRLGNTHAKILIKDDEYMITTSFNWLSFRGNPRREFREEWGSYIGLKEMIDEQFLTLKDRIVS